MAVEASFYTGGRRFPIPSQAIQHVSEFSERVAFPQIPRLRVEGNASRSVRKATTVSEERGAVYNECYF